MLSIGYNTKILLWLFAAIGFITGQSSTCGPPTPPYGSTIVHPPKQEKHNNGGVVLFGCKQGFYLVGSPLITCTGNTWTQIKFRCLGFCPELRSILNGKVVQAIPKVGMAAVEFQCNKNHRLIGNPRLECIEGRWNGILPFCEKLKSCVRLRPPANGTLHWNDTSHGAKASFACLTGFDLFGSSILTCNNGAWSTSVPTCKAYCVNIRDPFNGRKHGTRFSHGRMVSFECKFGYKLVGSRALVCINGRWNSSAPVCNAMLCPKPTIPSNSYIIYPGRNKDSYVHGTKLFLACRDGYYLTGLPIMECNQTVWLTTKFSCIASCPVLGTVKNGIITHVTLRDGGEVEIKCLTNYTLGGSSKLICRNGRWNDSLPSCGAPCDEPTTPMHGWKLGQDFRHGRSVRFFCTTGYHRVGAFSITCNDGVWDNQTPACKAQCNDPGSPIHGRKIGEVFRHHSWVQFLCDSNFKLDGNEWIQCIDGSWSASVPKCIGLASCDEPTNPVHGGRRDRDFKHGRSVRFYCLQRYQMIGASSITCNDGTWDNKVPVCKGFCGRPRTPFRGRLRGDSYLEGDEVIFTCDRNYDLFGNAKLRCVDRAWDSAVPKCKARCTYQGRPRNGYYHKGGMARGDKIKHGVQITYSCFRSYTLVGAKRQECNNGRWTDNTPLCKASCRSPGGITNGFKIGYEYGHGKTVQYKCNPKYTLEGQNQLTCDDGRWNLDPPKCKASCSPQQVPNNGKMHNNNSEHRALVSFSCNDGFQLNGSRQIKCIDGKWNDSAPICKENIALFKPTSQSSTYTTVNGRPLKSSYAVDGIKNTHYSHCTHTGTSTTTNPWWRVDLGRVKPVTEVNILNRGDCCGGRLDGAEIRVGNETTNGGATNPLCAGNIQVPQGKSKTFLCRPKTYGRYVSIRIPGNNKYLTLCEVEVYSSDSTRCNDPGLPNNGTKDGDNFRSGANVTFRCNHPFELVGSHMIFCRNGKWSNSIPTCAKCATSLGVENSNIQDFRITSPDSTDLGHQPYHARLNGPSSWCTSRQTYLQIDLRRTYKVTAIATQGGADLDKWVKRYKIGFYAGATLVTYSESGQLQKTIEGNKDASSIVQNQFKEPFVTKTVQIYPIDHTSTVCLRTEIYGCEPTPDCILVGSMFWGLWSQRNNSNNYYKAYITRIDGTHIDFALEINKAQKRRYKRTDPVLIIDKIPEMKDITVNASVIAVHKRDKSEWYRTGIVTVISSRASSVSVVFDDGQYRRVQINELRLVKRPRFCTNNM